MQPLFALVGAAGHKVRDFGVAEGVGPGVQQAHDHKAQHEVHEGPGAEDENALPGGLVGEGPGVVGRLVLPGHGAVAPKEDQAQGIEGLALLLFPDGGAHAQGKLLHPDTAGLGHQEMAALMDAHHQAEEQNCKDDIERCHLPKLSIT